MARTDENTVQPTATILGSVPEPNPSYPTPHVNHENSDRGGNHGDSDDDALDEIDDLLKNLRIQMRDIKQERNTLREEKQALEDENVDLRARNAELEESSHRLGARLVQTRQSLEHKFGPHIAEALTSLPADPQYCQRYHMTSSTPARGPDRRAYCHPEFRPADGPGVFVMLRGKVAWLKIWLQEQY